MQLAVDLSNILGYSLKTMLEGVATQVQSANGGAGIPVGNDSTNLAGIVATVLAAATFTWLNIGAVFIAVAAAIVTLLAVFVILALRKALIVLLVVIAPLAFVAYVLPNTEKLFHRWRKMFIGLLLVFPIIGVLFGASLLAHAILSLAAGADVTMQVVAYVVLVVPLIAVIPLLKNALNSVDGVGQFVNKLGTKAEGGARRAAGDRFDKSRLGQFKKHRESVAARRRASIQAGTHKGRGGKANPLNWLSSMNSAINDKSGRFGADMANRGAAIEAKEDAELMQNASSRLATMEFDGRPLSQAQALQMATRHDVTDAAGNVLLQASRIDGHMQRAAIQKAAAVATVAEAERLVDASRGMDVSARKTLAASMVSSSASRKAPHLGGRTIADIEQGTANSATAALAAVQSGKYTAAALAGSDRDTIASVIAAVSTTAAGSAERQALRDAYATMNGTPDLAAQVAVGGAHDAELRRIATL